MILKQPLTAASFVLFLFCVPLNVTAQTAVRVSPVLLRQAATQSPLPKFPVSSAKEHHSGVAVAQIMVGANGSTNDVKVLQSPDSAIAESVSKALLTWQYKPFIQNGKPTPVTCRFIFYFNLDEHGPSVVDTQHSAFE